MCAFRSQKVRLTSCFWNGSPIIQLISCSTNLLMKLINQVRSLAPRPHQFSFLRFRRIIHLRVIMADDIIKWLRPGVLEETNYWEGRCLQSHLALSLRCREASWTTNAKTMTLTRWQTKRHNKSKANLCNTTKHLQRLTQLHLQAWSRRTRSSRKCLQINRHKSRMAKWYKLMGKLLSEELLNLARRASLEVKLNFNRLYLQKNKRK